MRKELKEKKRIKLHNKRLVKKYPWLEPTNAWTGKKISGYNYEFTYLDCLPRGWVRCFGKMMIAEMDAASGGDIKTQEVKEKWGQMEWYCSSTKECQNVIEKYHMISANVCNQCGRPDCYMTDMGYMLPLCKKCFDNYYSRDGYDKYEDYIYDNDDGKIPDSYTTRRFSKEGYTDTVYDISDTVKKIRSRYEKKSNRKNSI